MSSSMEEEDTLIPTFLRKPDHNSPLPSHKSLHVFRRSRRRWREQVPVLKKKSNKKEHEDEDEDEDGEKEDGDDDREEIEMKIHALQRIVPGGESLGVDKLFDETAGYILALQYQVKALRALTGFFDKLDKEKKTKFGG
ncbi:transcription factor PAR1 [Cajanus cajan]|uniref:Transcription factor PAR1 n=1 Tax=Cajanus cajan TaxID=3821 RepID=A0A151U204_CAJCA|nr:transcription factor PAR1 [Cajanus cajan]KYP73359.1 hypothetical protein KK1_005979 [Cajanus cajan]